MLPSCDRRGDDDEARSARWNARRSAVASPARTSPACSASGARRSSTPTTSCSTRRSCPEAAAGTLEPRHVVVPLRQMCPHAELLLGRAVESRRGRAGRSSPRRSAARSRSATSGSSSRSARSRARSPCRGSPSTAAASRTSPTRSTLRNRVLRALESAAARLDPSRGRARPRLRLRRRRLRGSGGARGAPRPRSRGRSPLVPDAAPDARSAGCSSTRRRGSSPTSPEARRVHAPVPRGPRDRDPRRDDPRVVRRRRGRALRRDARPGPDAGVGRGRPRVTGSRAPRTCRSTTAAASRSTRRSA